MTGNGQSSVIIVAAGVIGLVVVGYLALKRLRKCAGKANMSTKPSRRI
jgi:LPXTG-motif cell wall-anchored protein